MNINQPHIKIQEILDRYKRKEITDQEALLEINQVRQTFRGKPLKELPLSWREIK